MDTRMNRWVWRGRGSPRADARGTKNHALPHSSIHPRTHARGPLLFLIVLPSRGPKPR